MTVIVTGHRGFIGGNLHTRLIEKQVNFIAYDAKDPGPYPYEMPQFKNMDIETIYHIGAMAGIGVCENHKQDALHYNVTNVEKWAQIALEKNARLVFTSSVAAASITPTWYGLTKKMAENILLHYKRVHNLKVTIFRLPNIYGRGSLHKTSVVANMCKDAILNKAVYVHGDGKQTRNFMHVDDTVKMLRLFNREGLFRVANANLYTIKHLAQEISEQFGVPIYETPKRPDALVPVDISNGNPHDISYNINVGFTEGLLDTINYFKKEVKPKKDSPIEAVNVKI